MFSKKMVSIGIILFLGLSLMSCSSSPKTENLKDSNTDINTEAISETATFSEATSQEQIVTIKDKILEQIIREKIEKPEGDITAGDMEMLFSININYEETPVYEIDGLEYALNLNDFSFRNGTLKSLNPVGNLKKMGYLNVSYSSIEEPILPFETPFLDRISFIETNVSDFEFLKGVTTAVDATFTICGVSSIAFMKDWMALDNIDLSENSITDLSPLEGKLNLKVLNLHGNTIESIEALSSLTALETLDISYNNISNIAPIMQLENLIEFTAYEDLDKKIIDRGLLETLEGKGVLVEYHK